MLEFLKVEEEDDREAVYLAFEMMSVHDHSASRAFAASLGSIDIIQTNAALNHLEVQANLLKNATIANCCRLEFNIIMFTNLA